MTRGGRGDYPFDMADPQLVKTVRDCGFDSATEEAILGGNAERLLQGPLASGEAAGA